MWHVDSGWSQLLLLTISDNINRHDWVLGGVVQVFGSVNIVTHIAIFLGMEISSKFYPNKSRRQQHPILDLDQNTVLPNCLMECLWSGTYADLISPSILKLKRYLQYEYLLSKAHDILFPNTRTMTSIILLCSHYLIIIWCNWGKNFLVVTIKQNRYRSWQKHLFCIFLSHIVMTLYHCHTCSSFFLFLQQKTSISEKAQIMMTPELCCHSSCWDRNSVDITWTTMQDEFCIQAVCTSTVLDSRRRNE